MSYDLVAHLIEQRDWSDRTFGPGYRASQVIAHIRKEIVELEAEPLNLEEWIDLVLLALDGAQRCAGGNVEAVAIMLRAKLSRNIARTWPDWRTLPAGIPSEHVRDATELPTSNSQSPTHNGGAA